MKPDRHIINMAEDVMIRRIFYLCYLVSLNLKIASLGNKPMHH